MEPETRNPRRMTLALTVAVAVGGYFSPAALAQQPPNRRPYDGIQAGIDAFRMTEQERRANAMQQTFLVDQLRFWNGLPTSREDSRVVPAAGAASLIPPQANLDFAYGYGASRPWGAVASPGGLLSVFEPWPFVPGDISGYPIAPQRAPQPSSMQQTQTGPNRWESHPASAAPASSPPAPAPPPAAMPPLAAPPTVDPIPPSEPAPPPPPPMPPRPRRGPREY